MHFSGKITNSLLNFIDKLGLSREQVLDLTELPIEFLRDPSAWIDADEMESLLVRVENELSVHLKEPGAVMTRVGHGAFELKSWGVLDSVLRMMAKTQDLYAQPQRFISYFVSPEPEIADLKKADTEISFTMPFAADTYPHFAEYLKAALEALPTYQGQPMAQIQWEDQRLTITWGEDQSSLFEKSESQLLKPEFVASLVQTLEASQKQIEEQKKQLVLKERELKRLESNATAPTRDAGGMPAVQIQSATDELLKLKDYFHRAQQLIVLLVGQDRFDRQVQAAMKRVDWEQITAQFNPSLEKVLQLVEKIPQASSESRVEAKNKSDEATVSTDLNRLMEDLVENVGREEGRKVKIEKMLFLDRPVQLRSVEMRSALHGFLRGSVRSLAPRSRLRIMTRPVNGRAELEISEIRTPDDYTPPAHSDQDISSLQQIVQDHQGRFNRMDRGAEGSTLVIQLPT